MRAAVENGADAIYFGLQQFNARLRAANFRCEDLPRLMSWLHERGVKGYVTINTLVFSRELAEAEETLRACSDAGVDAILVQDLGLAMLANCIVPGLVIHASTQMTVTCAESVHGLDALGLQIDRIVAAREMSRRELRRMKQDTEKEVEVFVHGAICVAYSGQCLTSEALGGRSANRGECAQACRLPYDLVVDGVKKDIGDVRYLLSPKDLCAYEDIGELMDLGIVSFKIEGRLKSPQYVAATVQSYRAAIETALGGAAPRIDEPTRRKLEMTFSRGFTGGYLHAIDHQAVVEGRFPKKRGLFLGRVTRVEKNAAVVRLEGPLKRGDGVVFDSGRPDTDEQGGRLYELFRAGRPIPAFDPVTDNATAIDATLRFGDGCVDFRKVKAGQLLWKTSDPALDAELAASYAEGRIHHRRPVHARVEGKEGEPIRLTLTDETALSVSVEDTAPAERALKLPLTREVLEQQLGRLGNTPFVLSGLDVSLQGELMVPMSRLNDLRRRAVEALLAKRKSIGTNRRQGEATLTTLRNEWSGIGVPPMQKPSLSVVCRTLGQVEAAVAHGSIHTVYTDFEDIRLHKESRKLIPPGGPRFAPATIRVVKPGEAAFVRILLECNPDAILVRNLSSWWILRELNPDLELIGDYSLNVANDLTAGLLYRHGLRTLTPSYDLNIDQLLDLLGHAPPGLFEVTIHQYMPLFHMEHCVFCRFLSEGTDFTNCGRPCESHSIALRDRVGFEHPVKADAGCRNTVFNAAAQSASAYLGQIIEAGVRRFRIDLLGETAAQAREVIDAYLPVLQGHADGSQLWRRLRASSKLGVTRGSLDHE